VSGLPQAQNVQWPKSRHGHGDEEKKNASIGRKPKQTDSFVISDSHGVEFVGWYFTL
jgi:hypothetical protein